MALDAAQMGMWDADLIQGTSRRSARHNEIFGYAGPPPEWGCETLLARVVAEDRDTVAPLPRQLRAALRGCGRCSQIRTMIGASGHAYHLDGEARYQQGSDGSHCRHPPHDPVSFRRTVTRPIPAAASASTAPGQATDR
jgi:hypothetical protein